MNKTKTPKPPIKKIKTPLETLNFYEKCAYCAKKPDWVNQEFKHSVCSSCWPKVENGITYERK